MAFFQNPFFDDFEGNWLLGDRHHIPKFVIKGNAGRGKEVVYAWTQGPYNLSGNDADGNSRKYLKIIFRLHHTKNWSTIIIDLTGYAGSASAVTTTEVVTALQSNTSFSERFLAELGSANDTTPRTIRIRQKKPITEFEFYIQNGQAEAYLGFNARAGIAELPSYFAMHTIANRFTYPTAEGRIIQLDPLSNVEVALIDNAVDARGNSLGYNHNDIQQDWQLLRGRSGIFSFTKGPSIGAVTSTETVINYPAGAKIGDLAEKVITKKDTTGAVVESYHMPYTLTSSDLIVPPVIYTQNILAKGLAGDGTATVAVA
jgi:hypothetical protein